MRVLVFLPCFTNGGAEKQGAILAKHLHSLGHSVEIWGFPAPGVGTPLLEEFREKGITTRQLPAWPRLNWQFAPRRSPLHHVLHRYFRWPRELRDCGRTIPGIECDVVVPFTPFPSLVASLFPGRMVASVRVWNHRGGYDSGGFDYSEFLVSRVKKRRPVFVANSGVGARFLTDVFGLEAGEAQVIRNAHVQTAPDVVSERRSGAAAIVNLAHVANVFREKDLASVISALPLLRERGVRCHLDVAGFFPDAGRQAALVEEAENLGVRAWVTFHGPVDKPRLDTLLARTDIGLLSSRSEGCPNSVMEYMDWQLPVVATDIPSIRELVGEEYGEWLFAVGDSRGLAERIARLAASPALRKALGERNRLRIREAFGPECAMADWVALLTNVLSRSQEQHGQPGAQSR